MNNLGSDLDEPNKFSFPLPIEVLCLMRVNLGRTDGRRSLPILKAYL